jgi:ABC-type Fe3+-siderophore transport system permease subunit
MFAIGTTISPGLEVRLQKSQAMHLAEGALGAAAAAAVATAGVVGFVGPPFPGPAALL